MGIPATGNGGLNRRRTNQVTFVRGSLPVGLTWCKCQQRYFQYGTALAGCSRTGSHAMLVASRPDVLWSVVAAKNEPS